MTTLQSKPPSEFRSVISSRTLAPLWVTVFSRCQRWFFGGLVSLWAITLVWFWHWWLQPQHIASIEGVAICSLLLIWDTILPAYYFFFVGRMQRPNPRLALPTDWRVAMVVTKAPSEPWPMVQKTLRAMMAQDYPHDTWLADENPTAETRQWCRTHGVQVSTRYGVAGYHRTRWPRRTKCKEGNLAYFYDHYGYGGYDFVAQLDADHIPSPGYLEAMLRPFLDERVGYVAAPSICDANADRSWVVNARLFAEATLHGSLQAGYNNGWAPLCIGSHYAVRTRAVQDIGGLGPELAEDHTTTLMMNAHGWRGVFAIDAEAHGDGPTSFADFLVQEFQWARSLVVVLLSVTPRYIGQLPPHLKFQFLFSQFWYPAFALIMLGGCLLPVFALVNNRPLMQVNYLEFLIRALILTMTCILPVILVKQAGGLRPADAKIISWETVLFQFARWPWILIAVCSAVLGHIRGQELPFKVTPKDQGTAKPLPLPLILPYLILALISGLTLVRFGDADRVQGYYFMAALNMLIYSGLCLLVLVLHFRENALKYRDYLPHYSLTGLSFGLLLGALTLHLGKGGKAVLAANPLVQQTLSAVRTINLPTQVAPSAQNPRAAGVARWNWAKCRSDSKSPRSDSQHLALRSQCSR
jgi:cellulose synthase (UDP-forming)